MFLHGKEFFSMALCSMLGTALKYQMVQITFSWLVLKMFRNFCTKSSLESDSYLSLAPEGSKQSDGKTELVTLVVQNWWFLHIWLKFWSVTTILVSLLGLATGF